MIVRPNPGPQERFLASKADIAVYGGSAGGGKSFALLMEPMRHVSNPDFGAVIFRRTTPQIRNEGGLWDTSASLYPMTGAIPREQTLDWSWPNGGRVSFRHMQYDSTVYDWQGSQVPLIELDELTHFTEKQFWYILSRNRSTCGVKPYMRASTNPKKDSWVRHLIAWWIGEDGFPIKERSGILRYFFREDDKMIWVDKDARDRYGNAPKSLTFIPAKLNDNPILMKKDPGYMANLAAQDRAERARLLDGNWDVEDSGEMFDPDWFVIADKAPPGLKPVRYWDRAATEVSADNKDPDWTAGALVALHDGDLWILDMQHFRAGPRDNELRIRSTAESDSRNVSVILEYEPGSSGKDVFNHYQTRVLSGFTVMPDRPTGSKVDRARPWAALAENRRVFLLRGLWNHDFKTEARNFPMGKKDQIDAVSGGYKFVTQNNVTGAASFDFL